MNYIIKKDFGGFHCTLHEIQNGELKQVDSYYVLPEWSSKEIITRMIHSYLFGCPSRHKNKSLTELRFEINAEDKQIFKNTKMAI